MIAAITALLIVADPVRLTPEADIWAYPHAADQRDPYLRVWGLGDRSTGRDAAETENASYSLLRFALPVSRKGERLLAAELVVTHIANPAWDAARSKANPIEARSVTGTIDEKSWTYDALFKLTLGTADADRYGIGFATEIVPDKEPEIRINLLGEKSRFAADVDRALGADGTLAIALTSRISAETRAVYKLFSKDAERAAVRPQLVLTFGTL
ncbi:MAG: hypothetical protein SFX74_02235 [Fimbriimonadaceae bacterium]|nr:hypothetical protein [Fimbriimonadaceae bacterium]